MGLRKTKDDLLEVVEVILQGLGEPIHYKQLTTMLVDNGLWVQTYPEPDQVLYGRIRTDIIRRGDDSAFRFMGMGIVCASTVRYIDEVAIPAEVIQAKAKQRDPEVEKRRRRPGETEQEYQVRLTSYDTQVCGNCAHLNFEQMYILTQRRGICHNYTNSRRCSVGVSQSPCEFWERRSQGQIRRDLTERSAILNALERANGKKK